MGSDGAAICQIKCFTGNLTSSQKNHIKKSWTERNLVITDNLTNPQRKWLDTLIKDADFPRHVHTIDWVEGLVSKYPDVVDHYFQDGKDRLETSIKSYLSIISPETSTQPAESRERVVDLHRTLNNLDPHYRYDFSVEAINPQHPPPASRS